MAGTPHGRINCYQTTGLANILMASTVFTSLYKGLKALEALGVTIEVSNNYGNGSGFDYHDGASPVGTSGFALFRMPPSCDRAYSLYLLLQYVDTGALGTTWNALYNGAAAHSYGNVGVTFAAALDLLGVDSSPCAAGWGTDLDGADEKPSPAWATPAGGKLWLGDRTNAVGGDDVATGSNLHKLAVMAGGVPANSRWGVIADTDSIFFYFDLGDVGTPQIVAAAQFVPYDDFAEECPFLHASLRLNTGGADTTMFGLAIGNVAGSLTSEVTSPFHADGDAKISGVSFSWGRDSDMQPSSLSSKYSDGPVELFAEEGLSHGLVGVFDRFLGFVSNLAGYNTLSTTAPRLRIVISPSGALDDWKLSVPWDGTSTPQDVALDRDGVDFSGGGSMAYADNATDIAFSEPADPVSVERSFDRLAIMAPAIPEPEVEGRHSMMCVDRMNLSELWNDRDFPVGLSAITMAAQDRDCIFVVGDGDVLPGAPAVQMIIAIAKSDGAELWQSECRPFLSVASDGSRVYATLDGAPVDLITLSHSPKTLTLCRTDDLFLYGRN